MTPLIPWFLRRTRSQTPLMLACALAVLALAMAVQAGEPGLPTADSVPDASARPSVPPDDPAVQAHLPGCAVWTDRCVTCQHKAGRTFCSNIGIACQPQAIECVRSEQAEEKEEKKPEN